MLKMMVSILCIIMKKINYILGIIERMAHRVVVFLVKLNVHRNTIYTKLTHIIFHTKYGIIIIIFYYIMIFISCQIYYMINDPIYCDAFTRPVFTGYPRYWHIPNPTYVNLATDPAGYIGVTAKEKIALTEAIQESMSYKRMENLSKGLNINAGIEPRLLDVERSLAPERAAIVKEISDHNLQG